MLTLLGGPLAASEDRLHLDEATQALAEGRWVDAEMGFRRAIQEQPTSIEAHAGLARAQAGRGDVEGAVQALVTRARAWLPVGRLEPAEQLLATAVELRPDDATSLVLLGRSRILQRRYLAAEEPLARVYELGAADADALLYYGATLWENGDLERAEAVLREALELRSDSLPALYQLSRLLLWQSRYEEAAELLQRCAGLAPEAPDVRLDLARALSGAGRPEALDAYRRALELAPEHSELRYGYAMSLLRAGDRIAAESELARYRELYQAEQSATREQGLAAARVARGAELLRQGALEEAEAHLRQLPPSPDGLATLAATLRAQGDLKGAVAELSRAVALAPDRDDLRARLNDLRLEELRNR